MDMGFSQARLESITYARRALAFALFLVAIQAVSALVSAPPLLGKAGSSARQSVTRAAESYLGTPYRFGGTSKSGIDCSGLVYRAFLQGTGFKVPRTVDTLARWVLPIPFSDLAPGDLVFFTLNASSGNISQAAFKQISIPQNVAYLSKADHVGIYLGDGLFIHSASSGSKTGVIKSSIHEESWSHRYLFAGRALPASAFSGFALDGGFGLNLSQLENISGGLDAIVRGASGWGELSLPLFNNFSIGVRASVSWDRSLGTLRLPFELDIGQISGISAFAGPAFTFGSAMLDGRGYTPAHSILGTVGLRWSPIIFSSGAERFGSYFEVRYDNYSALPGQESAFNTDLKACLSFSIGLRLRSVRY